MQTIDMFSETADLYDLIYSQFKDYAEETRNLAAILHRVHPGARTLLDVGCGTGEHARILSEQYGYEVDGIDVNPEFVAIARAKNSTGEFFCRDMVEFDLDRRFDTVLCLFSAIGYVKTLENVRKTLDNFRSHLAEGGVVIIEPWFPPGALEADKVYMKTAETDELKVCRMSRTHLSGRLSTLEWEYLIGRPEGISRAQEVHELGLFTVEEMKACFAAVGMEATYDPVGLMGRGLYIGRTADHRAREVSR